MIAPINRRETIALLGSAARWPLAAWAQQGNRVRRIGVLMPVRDEDETKLDLVSATAGGRAAAAHAQRVAELTRTGVHKVAAAT